MTATEMKNNYTQRLSRKGHPARTVYDKLINSAPNGLCPLCGIGTATTLDHHLPKSKYPILSVVSANLVPACQRCQTEKKETYPKDAYEQTFHPYFDDFDSDRWLISEVLETNPAVFSFSVSIPEDWDELVYYRLAHHMKTFNLPKLYSINAANELAGIRSALNLLAYTGGVVAVREYLERMAGSWETSDKNDWRTAMYHAAYESDWFCDGGYDQT